MMIDLNCDLGEGVSTLDPQQEAELMSMINSANIACGVHAGCPESMERSVQLALLHGVRIGAHPGYPDRANFGRKSIAMSSPTLTSWIKYQVAAIQGVALSLGGVVEYVKPHGALYHDACRDWQLASTLVDSIAALNPELGWLGLPGSQLMAVCQQRGIPFMAEGFVDRRYRQDGSLVPRGTKGAHVEDLEVAVNQALNLAHGRTLTTLDGGEIRLQVQSLCVHGDNAQALELARALVAAGIGRRNA